MKIYASKDVLTYGVQAVIRAVSNKNPIPILSGILLSAAGGQLTFSATDLELGIECKVPVNIEEEGNVVLPAKYLNDIFRRLPDVQICIQVDKNNYNTTMQYGSNQFNLLGIAAEDFPLLPTIDSTSTLEIKQDVFKSMIKQVSFASSADDNRPIFTGVLMEIKDGNIKLIATDTHRLAFREGKSNMLNGDVDTSVIVPSKALAELNKLMTGETENLKLSLSDNQISFELPGIRIVSRLIEGQFPNYKQVIPQGCKTKIKVNNKDFLEATERASLLAKDGSNVIKLVVSSDTMIITSNNPEVGKIEEQLPIEVEGEETQIAFNSRYLIDVFKVMDSEAIFLELTGSLSPGIIKPVHDNHYLYLILPIRII